MPSVHEMEKDKSKLREEDATTGAVANDATEWMVSRSRLRRKVAQGTGCGIVTLDLDVAL